MQRTLGPVFFLLTSSSLLAAAVADESARLARDILDGSGVQGGLVVHVGCGDGRLTAALRANDRYLVHGLDTDAENVAKARRHVQAMGLGGKVSVERLGRDRLPYADNLVNVLVADDLGDVPMDEVMRVLRPLGVAYVKSGDEWTKTVKPWPDEIDEWTHFLHDASGNAVAHDRLVAAPRRLQWIGGPLWSRSHEYDSSLCAMVSAHGRLFYVFDEGPTGIVDRRIPDKWMLIARDAFNGVVLWRREVGDWGWKAWKRAEMEQTDWQRMRSQRHRLPVAVARRLVAAGDRVYATLGYRAPLTALDAATGRTLTTYEGTERTDEIVHHGALLVLCIRTSMEGTELPGNRKGQTRRQPAPAFLRALDAATGRRLWQTEPGVVVPVSLAMSGPNVFYHDRDGVVALDAATGRQRWRTPALPAGNSVWNTEVTLVVHNGVVLCGRPKQLVAMSVEDGKELWKLPGARGFGAGNPPDLFVADGVVWYAQGNVHAESITGYDPLTGKPARTVKLGGLITRGHHARCYRSKATDDYLLLPKRAIEFVNLKGGPHSRHNWVRGACRYGVLPCNGLLYSTPHPCFCYAGVKLGGFLALSAEKVEGGEKREEGGEKSEERAVRGSPDPAHRADRRSPRASPGRPPVTQSAGSGDPRRALISRLKRGPAYAPAVHPSSFILHPLGDWPMYRHDPKRSGSSPTVVEPHVRPIWKTPLAGKLTQPIVVGLRLFVARVDAGQLCCLDAATGERIWDYTAGGRIDSAPSYYQGRLIFGSADGWVYCLRAADGVLAWRFRAAPDERRVVAFGQLESAWPVHGSVLVMGDVVYFTAGRSSFLDGGITLYGLDPVTGEKRCETRLDGPHPDTSKLDENAYAMEGAKSDILVTDGTLIYLFHNAFNKSLEKQPTPIKGKPGVRNLGVRDFGEHLFSNAGFLDTSGFNRSYWMLHDRWPAFNFAHQSPKAGQLVVFDDAHTYAAKCFVRRNMLSPQAFPATDGYYLVADSNATRPVLLGGDGKAGPDFIRWLPQSGELQTCWNLGVGFARSQPPQWVNVLPVRICAMVRTANALFAAGPPDLCGADDPAAALEGRKGAVLVALSPADGKTLFECKLDTPPVFDGMAAAAGHLYIAATDGSVLCLGKAD